jgi:hypothetical protein
MEESAPFANSNPSGADKGILLLMTVERGAKAILPAWAALFLSVLLFILFIDRFR